MISFLSISVVTCANVSSMINRGSTLPLIAYAGCCLLWVMFFVTGCALSTTDRNYSLCWSAVIILVGIVLSCLETRHLWAHYGMGAGIKPSSFVFSMGVILLLMSKRAEEQYKKYNCIVTRSLEYLGHVSFFVYLCHFYIVKFLLPHVSIISHFWAVKFLLAVALTLLVLQIARRIVPHKSQHLLGIYD